VRVAPEKFEVPGQLLDAVDVAASLDLDGDGCAVSIAHHEVDGADRRRILAAHEGRTLADQIDLFGQQALQIGLDAVLLESRIDAELVRRVVQYFVDLHAQGVAGLFVRHTPDVDDAGTGLFFTGFFGDEGARRAHPVQRLV